MTFYQHRASLIESRRMNYILTSKGHIEKLTYGQGHGRMGKGHVANQAIRIVDLNHRPL